MTKLITWKQLKTDLGIPYSRQHIGRLEDAKQFPKRVTLGQARVAWVLDEVEAWIDQRLKQRDNPSS
ncbi:MAG: AlpA family phage regulatory protein [Devosia sp.]